MEFQTRSEDNGMRMFPTLKEAMEHAKTDDTVWKVSFILPNGEAVRLLPTADGEWAYRPIA